ncbi:MAG TPA: hypothetical protein VNN20_06110 [Thermodesulfobacteriota bacterium]|nr:hypothetical protein [Thermodesulfobacteriota bacterium]
MPELKPLETFRINQEQTEFLDQELLTELYEIEKEIAESRRERDEVARPVHKCCTPISEEGDKLDNLIHKHCSVMRKLRILWTHNILEKTMFYRLYGGVELKITD